MKALNVIYHTSRDWLGSANTDFQMITKKRLIDTFDGNKTLFLSKEGDEVLINKKELSDKITALSSSLQEFRKHGLQLSEMSRVSQYISKIGGAIESMKVVLKYRTPVTLRAYSKVFIYSFPILYGPYFGFVSKNIANRCLYF